MNGISPLDPQNSSVFPLMPVSFASSALIEAELAELVLFQSVWMLGGVRSSSSMRRGS